MWLPMLFSCHSLLLPMKGDPRGRNNAFVPPNSLPTSKRHYQKLQEAGYESPKEVRQGKERVREAFRFPKIGGK